MVQLSLPNTDSLDRHYERYNAGLKDRVDYAYNPMTDDFALVGDDAANLTERHCGNANLMSSLSSKPKVLPACQITV